MNKDGSVTVCGKRWGVKIVLSETETVSLSLLPSFPSQGLQGKYYVVRCTLCETKVPRYKFGRDLNAREGGNPLVLVCTDAPRTVRGSK